MTTKNICQQFFTLTLLMKYLKMLTSIYSISLLAAILNTAVDLFGEES